MTIIKRDALVPYSVTQMYELVNDIDSYPQFLQWCSGATVLSRSDQQVEASLHISHSGLNKAFTTRNILQDGNRIEMHLVEGPFKKLEGVWLFTPLGEQGCKVSLNLEFEFSSKILGLSLGPVFSRIANTLVDSFTQRAVQVYGS